MPWDRLIKLMRRARRRVTLRGALIGGASAMGAVAVAGAVFLIVILNDLPSEAEIVNRHVNQSTKIYDRTGEVLLYEISAGERRTVVPFAEIPQRLKDATLAAEDQRFYEEPAFSWRGILRAFLVNLQYGEVRQGGSTITQQLAKNAFLSPERTPTRKIKELILAARIGRNYSKDDILALYLNEVPFGSTLYGIEAASQAYFAKPARDLTLAESAVLAAVLRAPSYYSPWGQHRDELFGRERYVLDQMLALGKITPAEHAAALNATVAFAPQTLGIKAPHFVLAVQDYLSKTYGEDALREGGLTVRTTLDWKIQEIAERVVKEGAERNEKLYQGKNAALVAQDPKTGQVLALVGSRDYGNDEINGKFNAAMQGLGRQPGSSLKPFVYLEGFLKGYRPETMLFDVPTEFAANRPDCPAVPDFETENDKCFHPQNFDHIFRGPVTLREALAQSVNVPAVKMLYLAGMRDTLELMKRLGITTLDDPGRYGLTLVLGGGEVRLIELVGAYATIAADGTHHDQAMVLEVKDARGKVLEAYEDRAESAVDPEYARLLTDVLSDVDARRGLFSGSLPLTQLPDRDVAMKTGTTDNYKDAWTAGYTPSLAAGVWVGNNDGKAMQRQGSSILAALPIWHAFMEEATKLFPAETFERSTVPPAERPILAGNFAPDGEIHDILYYVDRNDPAGAPPANPADDPQFANWEEGVRIWASTRSLALPAAVSTSTPFGGSATLPGAPRIDLTSPRPGAFMGNAVTVAAKIDSPTPLARIRVFLNGTPVQEFPGAAVSPYFFSFSFAPQNPGLQNLIELEATNRNNLATKASVVVFR